MATITAYWRPASIGEAFELLARPGVVALGGGTQLVAGAEGEAVEVVDLQALHLDGVDPVAGDWVQIGAMATLQAVADSELVPVVVREAARRELPSTLRAQATIGGCIAGGDWESELLAALLAYEAVVSVRSPAGSEDQPLESVLADLPLPRVRIVVAVTIPTAGAAAVARTARTPADRAIVAAVVRATEGGLRAALSGVAWTPVVVDGADGLHPPGDFRGSSEYRRALAATLLARATEAIR